MRGSGYLIDTHKCHRIHGEGITDVKDWIDWNQREIDLNMI